MSPNSIRKRTSVHESTVKKANDMEPVKKKRARAKSGRSRTVVTHSIKVDPRVMKDAKKRLAELQAEGKGYTRLEIVDNETVVLR